MNIDSSKRTQCDALKKKDYCGSIMPITPFGQGQILKQNNINSWVEGNVFRGLDPEGSPQRSYNEDFLSVMKVRTVGNHHALGILIPYKALYGHRRSCHLLPDVPLRFDY
jgi:hypothetical protein